jgi:hypothetical protein
MLGCGHGPPQHRSLVAGPGCEAIGARIAAHMGRTPVRIHSCSDSILTVILVAQTENTEQRMNDRADSLARLVWESAATQSRVVRLGVLRGDVALSHCFATAPWRPSEACEP